MKYRQQESEQERSEVFGTTAGLVDRMDIPPSKVFRAFREVDNAVKFMGKHDDSTGKIVRYGTHKNDVRVIVHYLGKAKRDRVKLTPKREIMRNGVNVNRLLPIAINFSEA